MVKLSSRRQDPTAFLTHSLTPCYPAGAGAATAALTTRLRRIEGENALE